jgi:hypothetical protein
MALALPLLLFLLYVALGPVVEAAKADPVGESIIIVAVLAFTAVVLVREFRRVMRRPSLAGQLWCSPHAIFPGTDDELSGVFGGSPEHVRNVMNIGGPVPTMWLVLTARQLLVVPIKGDDPPLACDLSDVSRIGVSCAGRRENGVSITRRNGRAVGFMFRPDKKLVRELERLGATIVDADAIPS